MPTLDNMQWQAVSIGGKRVIERSAPTLLLDADGQLSGSTGCNNYFGHWSAFGSNASFEASGASLRACEPELMEQERAFLNALKTTTSIAASPDGTLSLVDATSVVQLLLVSVDQENDSAAPTVPSDLPNSTLYRFECGDAGPVEFRFLGPETIELTVKPERYILQHQRAASGAQYEGDDAEFWNRGNEAILALGGERFRCERSAD